MAHVLRHGGPNALLLLEVLRRDLRHGGEKGRGREDEAQDEGTGTPHVAPPIGARQGYDAAHVEGGSLPGGLPVLAHVGAVVRLQLAEHGRREDGHRAEDEEREVDAVEQLGRV